MYTFKILLADILMLFHYFILIIVMFIPIFAKPESSWLKYNLLLVPLILLDWDDYENGCSFTTLESKLRGTWKREYRDNNDSEDAPRFFVHGVNAVLKPFNIKLTYKQADKLNNVLFLISWLIAYIRFTNISEVNVDLLDTNVGIIGKMHVYLLILFVIVYAINFLY